jgi:hypothetical protein
VLLADIGKSVCAFSAIWLAVNFIIVGFRILARKHRVEAGRQPLKELP